MYAYFCLPQGTKYTCKYTASYYLIEEISIDARRDARISQTVGYQKLFWIKQNIFNNSCSAHPFSLFLHLHKKCNWFLFSKLYIYRWKHLKTWDVWQKIASSSLFFPQITPNDIFLQRQLLFMKPLSPKKLHQGHKEFFFCLQAPFSSRLWIRSRLAVGGNSHTVFRSYGLFMKGLGRWHRNPS